MRAELFSAEQMGRHGGVLAAGHRLERGRARDRLLARLSDNQRALLETRARSV